MLRLIDRLIDLAKRREEQGKSYYGSFVAPAFLDFEALHTEYLRHFRQYRDMLQDRAVSLGLDHPILDALRRDAIFAAHLNAKVVELVAAVNDQKIYRFTMAIAEYMNAHADAHGLRAPHARDSSREFRRE
jgi:hypothetical protein